MTTPNPDWPHMTVPLPVRFRFDPAGTLYFGMHNLPVSLDERTRQQTLVKTARELFLPYVATLNTAPALGERTPEAFTELPELATVADDIARWLA